MKKFYTRYWEITNHFEVFGMYWILNAKNFVFEVIPGIRFTIYDSNYAIVLSWLTLSIEFIYITQPEKIKNNG